MIAEKSLLNRLLEVGLEPQKYFSILEENAKKEHDLTTMTEDEVLHAKFYPINFQRTSRILNTLEIRPEISNKIKTIQKQYWMVITETWCGDSSQSLPIITKLAEQNSNIVFKIILRDSYPEIMDQFLTNGTKSIPILLVLDEKGNLLGKWGPRPKDAIKLFAEGKAKGMVKDDILQELHLWYGRNRGEQIQQEILDMLGL